MVTPKKSPTTENVIRRRKDLEKSERAAYWALLNTCFASILYYDLYYLNFLCDQSVFINILEWTACSIFTISACYDYIVHFWSQLFMKPILINPVERRLLGIQDDEVGFQVEDTKPRKYEPIYDDLPPFEIQHSFEDL